MTESLPIVTEIVEVGGIHRMLNDRLKEGYHLIQMAPAAWREGLDEEPRSDLHPGYNKGKFLVTTYMLVFQQKDGA